MFTFVCVRKMGKNENLLCFCLKKRRKKAKTNKWRSEKYFFGVLLFRAKSWVKNANGMCTCRWRRISITHTHSSSPTPQTAPSTYCFCSLNDEVFCFENKRMKWRHIESKRSLHRLFIILTFEGDSHIFVSSRDWIVLKILRNLFWCHKLNKRYPKNFWEAFNCWPDLCFKTF